MTQVTQKDDPEALRLRAAIAAEIIALRHAIPFRTRAYKAGEVTNQVSSLLRSNPAWAAGAAAGALAGTFAGLFRRLRRHDGE